MNMTSSVLSTTAMNSMDVFSVNDQQVCNQSINNMEKPTNEYLLNERFLHHQSMLKKTTTGEFRDLYNHNQQSAQLNFDPLTSIYMDMFDKDPIDANAETAKRVNDAIEEFGNEHVRKIMWSKGRHHPLKSYRKFDARLNVEEKQRFKQHGLVVSERLGVESFAEGYYRLYSDNLPVFITADSVLHAWHRSFDAILKELEIHCLMVTLSRILSSMHNVLRHIPNKKICADADYFIAIARSLLSGRDDDSDDSSDYLLDSSSDDSDDEEEEKEKKVTEKKASTPDEKAFYYTMEENAERCKRTLQSIERQKTESMELFGKLRDVDFSQFKPRGHYESSESLQRYFKTMMWLGRMDLQLNGKESSTEQVQFAVVLVLLVRFSEEGIALWQSFEKTLRVFIGPVDSMTIEELNRALEVMIEHGELEGISSMDQLWDITPDLLSRIKSRIGELSIGKQLINSAVRYTTPGSDSPLELPQSFTFLGQRFTLDVFAMTRSVYDNLVWENQTVQRRIPSGLDVAFSVFQNDNVVEELARRAEDKGEKSIKFRDGLPVVHALIAARRTVDELSSDSWSESLYSMWLDCIRQLSKPSRHTSSTFHSKAWAMRTLNTQMASYTELKHDTILYAKQGYTMSTMCEHADVFVEPIPEFWTAVRQMAERASALLKSIDLYDKASDNRFRRDLPTRDAHASFFDGFAGIVAKLEKASLQLVNKEQLSEEQVEFLKSVMEESFGSGSSKYLGWYPKLFYNSREDSGKWDPLVADIHTNAADPTVKDPGCVVHQAVGNVFMGFFSVDTGSIENPKPVMFAGPVFSYYEFSKPIDTRMADSEWRSLMRSDPSSMPDLPGWATSTYLVAGENNHTVKYHHAEDR